MNVGLECLSTHEKHKTIHMLFYGWSHASWFPSYGFVGNFLNCIVPPPPPPLVEWRAPKGVTVGILSFSYFCVSLQYLGYTL